MIFNLIDEKFSLGHFCDSYMLSCRKNLFTQHPLKYKNDLHKDSKIVHIFIQLGFSPVFLLCSF